MPQQALPAGRPHTTRLPPSLTGCWLLRQPGGHSVQVHLKQLYFKVNQWVHHKYPYLSLIFLVHPIYYFIIRLIILLICVILCNGGGEQTARINITFGNHSRKTCTYLKVRVSFLSALITLLPFQA